MRIFNKRGDAVGMTLERFGFVEDIRKSQRWKVDIKELLRRLYPYSFATTISEEHSPVNWPNVGKHIPPEGSVGVRSTMEVLPFVPAKPGVIVAIIGILGEGDWDWSIQPSGDSIKFVIDLGCERLFDQFNGSES